MQRKTTFISKSQNLIVRTCVQQLLKRHKKRGQTRSALYWQSSNVL